MKHPDIKWSGVLPNGSASRPEKDSNHFYIASLDPNQRLGVLPDGSASQAGSEPVKANRQEKKAPGNRSKPGARPQKESHGR